MIPFENTWPYERMKDDLFFSECPSCKADNVLLPLKRSGLASIQSGARKLLVMPCCHASYKLIDADGDYVMADQPMRK